ncbi:cytochrome c1 heme lyase [Grosmannia clavigera kw1407]|uniref:Holocytochrome c-type synthase n=1 Tax=Grosmannia clavigera (strain kw1407 / UAMH 11150) TaxID=655863 RepID=F0X7R5_GROCL|nr:cytochrome c1 heme lyase [Grosmannia clavigera kw1407]EFX06626.1 cytochrome c1 heme lyase [Grosmannia clavigera kw1407]
MAGGENGRSNDAAAVAVCPVDHKTRDLWLAQAREQAEAQAQALAQDSQNGLPQTSPQATAAAAAHLPSPSQASQTQPTTAPARKNSSWWPSSFFSSSFAAPANAGSSIPHAPPQPSSKPDASLDNHRVVSSIPRTAVTQEGVCPVPAASAVPAADCPVNHEVETGADPVSGNWVYPSEKMFFDAMRRKGNDNARAADMRVVVPIHNAVNERAWKEILEWEAPYAGTGRACGGPRLHSFAGLSTHMTPRARLYTLLGYSAPFDRHDWVVDRCGTRVDYVIDFYAGRPTAAGTSSKLSPSVPAGKPQISFYLDVRPKLNTWEGVRMRALRAVGLA